MIEEFPYSDLIRAEKKVRWSNIREIVQIMHGKVKKEQEITSEIFALKILLDETWFKWFIIPTNLQRTNQATQIKIQSLWNKSSRHFADIKSGQAFSARAFWRANLLKIFLQTLNLDYLFYGDNLRTNLKLEVLNIFRRRSWGLMTINNAVFYLLPILLIQVHPVFIALPFLFGAYQGFLAYQRTLKHHYLNEINRVLGFPVQADS